MLKEYYIRSADRKGNEYICFLKALSQKNAEKKYYRKHKDRIILKIALV